LDHISCFHYCPVGLSCILFYFLPNQIKCLCLLCSGIAVSMVMKYADNIVKVLTTIFSVTCVCKQCRSEPQQLISRLNECVATSLISFLQTSLCCLMRLLGLPLPI
jgi:hypothetical protein